MNTTVLYAILVALATGFFISVQSSFINLTGQLVGPLRTSFFVHVTGTLIGALLVLVFVFVLRQNEPIPAGRSVTAYSLIAGGLGMMIVIGVSFTFPRIGLLAGQATILLGQLTTSTLIDSTGLAGDPIPLDWRRIVGLLMLGGAVYLLLPRQAG